MHTITPEALTVESFAPYGRVVEHLEHAPTKEGENWRCYSPMEFILPDAPMGIGIVYCDTPPAAITAMERHVSREEVLWSTTEDILMAVDLPVYLGDEKARPNVATTKVFHIKAGQVLVINRGTWHSPGFAVQGTTKYYFMVEFKPDFIDQDAAPWIPFADDVSIAIAPLE